MPLVTTEFFTDRFPRELTEFEERRLTALLVDAEQLIRDEFHKVGRDLTEALEVYPWLLGTVQRVVFAMVSAAILVGVNAGVRSVSSATGPINDSVTYADVNATSWGSVLLTPAQRAMLGLSTSGSPVGAFPAPRPWPERSIE